MLAMRIWYLNETFTMKTGVGFEPHRLNPGDCFVRVKRFVYPKR